MEVLVEAQVNSRERHAEVEVERLADLDEFGVQTLGGDMLLHGGIDLEHDRHGDGKFGGTVLIILLGGGCLPALRGSVASRMEPFRASSPFGFIRRALQGITQREDNQREGEELDFREPGDERHRENHHAADEKSLGRGEDLLDHIAAESSTFLAPGAGDDHGGADRNEQRGNLRNQPVANREDRVGRDSLVDLHAFLRHADQDAGDDIDRDHDEGGDGIALHELHRAVHRAEELAFLFDHAATALRVLHGDVPSAQVGIDAHLLAGHGIEREPRRNLGDALRAFGDHDELNNEQDEENHHADDEISADDKVSEGVDDLTRVGLDEDHAGGGDIQREPKERGHQQHARESRERQRVFHVERHEKQHGRDAEIQRDQCIEDKRRHRHDHQGDNRNDDGRNVDVAVALRGEGEILQPHQEGLHHASPPPWPDPARVFKYSAVALSLSTVSPNRRAAMARTRWQSDASSGGSPSSSALAALARASGFLSRDSWIEASVRHEVALRPSTTVINSKYPMARSGRP